jgi:hypothetical protein
VKIKNHEQARYSRMSGHEEIHGLRLSRKDEFRNADLQFRGDTYEFY